MAPAKDVNAPPASCTKRSAAARSQSWLLPPATAMSNAPCATRARRSASDRTRGMTVSGGAEGANHSRNFFGPEIRACASSAPVEAAMAAPLSVAPALTRAAKISAVTVANKQARIGRPFSISAADTAQSGRPARKARVPSIGSTIQTRRAASRAGSSTLSSDSQPTSPPAAASRSRSRLSTAMSASVTGDNVGPLVQFFSGVWNIDSASKPASRTAAASTAARRAKSSTCESPTLMSGNSKTLHPQGRRVGAVAKGEVVGRCEAGEHPGKMAGDGDFAHCESEFAVFDPESGSAAAIIAGHHVDAGADQVGDIKAVLDLGDQRRRAGLAGRQVKIARPRRGDRGHDALGVAGGFQIEFARRGAVEQPGFQHTVFDQFEVSRRNALGVEGARALAAMPQRIVDDVDARRENPLSEFFAQKTRLARYGAAIGGAGEVADQRAGNPRVEYHRHSPRRDLARVQPFDRALARIAADRVGTVEIGGMQRRGEIVILFHADAVAGDGLHRDRV